MVVSDVGAVTVDGAVGAPAVAAARTRRRSGESHPMSPDPLAIPSHPNARTPAGSPSPSSAVS